MPPETLILGFDTSGPHCGAVLLSGDRVLAARTEEMTRGQAERLMPLLEETLATGGKNWSDLDGLGVGVGPGNFTGIRISVSAARGLALALSVPAVGVSGLEALAHGSQNVIACLPAPRGRTYVQAFVAGAPAMPALADLDRKDLPNYPAGAAPKVIGPNAPEVARLLGEDVADARYPMVEAIARLGCSRLGSTPPMRPSPLYLREADAAPPSQPAPVIVP